MDLAGMADVPGRQHPSLNVGQKKFLQFQSDRRHSSEPEDTVLKRQLPLPKNKFSSFFQMSTRTRLMLTDLLTAICRELSSGMALNALGFPKK